MTALLDVVLTLYCSLLVMRALMDLAQISFEPLLHRLIFLGTEPVIRPLRRLLPRIGGLDWAIPILLLGIQLVVLLLLTEMTGTGQTWSWLVVFAILRSIQLVVLLLLVLVAINFLLLQMSLIPRHPLVPLIRRIVDWLLSPLRNIWPGIRPALAHLLAAAVLGGFLIMASLAFLGNLSLK